MPRADRQPSLDPIDGRGADALRRVTGAAIGLVLRALVRLDTSQLPNRLELGPRPLLVTNHRSPLDYLVVVSVCRAHGRWPAMFAREDFFAPAPSRYLLRRLALIPASRGRGAPEGLRRAERMLATGHTVAIAAEGGLVLPQDRPDGVGRLRGGAGRLAAGGADVTVLTIVGADEAWPPGTAHPCLRPPRHRPVVTVRAQRVRFAPDLTPSEATTVIRATMVDLVGGDVVPATRPALR